LIQVLINDCFSIERLNSLTDHSKNKSASDLLHANTARLTRGSGFLLQQLCREGKYEIVYEIIRMLREFTKSFEEIVASQKVESLPG
jgi:hypothetical protein